MTSMTACRQTGGFVTPSPRDLSGLEGRWTYNVTFRGELEGWMKTDEVYEKQYGHLYITRDSISTEYGTKLNWYYDGERLVIGMRIDEYDYNEYCGTVNLSIFADMEIYIVPTGTSGSIRGESEASLTTDYCDWTSGWLRNDGYIHKQKY